MHVHAQTCTICPADSCSSSGLLCNLLCAKIIDVNVKNINKYKKYVLYTLQRVVLVI